MKTELHILLIKKINETVLITICNNIIKENSWISFKETKSEALIPFQKRQNKNIN